MEHGSQKATGGGMRTLLLFALAASAWGQSRPFEVRHERALLDHPGRITFEDSGLLYEQVLTPKQQKKVAQGKKPPKLETARWDYQDIQQLWLSPDKLVVVTYKDRKWFLGVDKEFEFYLTAKDQSFTAVYERLKGKLDERFVAALADPAVAVDWEIPVKLLGAVQGSEGILQIGENRIVYQTGRKHQSRTWRLEDIENVSTSGPYQLTLTTHERAITHYGGWKGFNFQLKRKLDAGRFDRLWKRLNRDKGLEFLTSLQERKQ
jgi:hypothetical protein